MVKWDKLSTFQEWKLERVSSESNMKLTIKYIYSVYSVASSNGLDKMQSMFMLVKIMTTQYIEPHTKQQLDCSHILL